MELEDGKILQGAGKSQKLPLYHNCTQLNIYMMYVGTYEHIINLKTNWAI